MSDRNDGRGNSSDEAMMREALRLARKGEGLVEPNPMVGCVLVHGDEIVGRGNHGRFGGPHAEVAALQSMRSPSDAEGATAYVTLEPCCHHGKTPPCSVALIRAGVKRVVIAMQDPFSKVDGGGIKQLTDAGIETTVGVLGDEASELISPYLKRVRQGRPWVIAKWAMTIDGRIATKTGESQWITSEASREQVHRLRSRVDAIVVGMGTVVADDPLLTARLSGEGTIPRTATRVVFCRHRVPDVSSLLIQTARRAPVLLVVAESIDENRTGPLEALGAKVMRCSDAVRGAHAEAGDSMVRMVSAALEGMGEMGMTNVMLEGGGELLGSFMTAGHIDECHVYLGPKLFGGSASPGPIAGTGVAQLQEAPLMNLVSIDSFGDDVRLIYRRG